MDAVIVGTYSQDLGFVKGEGLGIVIIDEKDFVGEKERKAAAVSNSIIANSSYLTVAPDGMVYALDERNDLGESGGRLYAFRVLEDKSLEQVGPSVECGDTSSCHLAVHKNYVVVANYCGGGGSKHGSVACVSRDPKSGALGSVQLRRFTDIRFPRTDPGVNADRQDTSHAHMIYIDNEDTVLVTDLGSDIIWRFSFDDKANSKEPLSEPTILAVSDPGDGPRHMWIANSRRLLFVLNELSCTLSVFDLGNEKAKCIKKVPLLPTGKSVGDALAAAMQLTDHAVYCSLRMVDGPGLIAYYTLDQTTGLPADLCHIESGGSMPREIKLISNDSMLLAANQNSNTITVFDVDPTTGALSPSTIPPCACVGTPVCISELSPPSSSS